MAGSLATLLDEMAEEGVAFEALGELDIGQHSKHWARALDVLRGAKEQQPDVFTKSSLMVGLGETQEELVEAIGLLRDAGVGFLTLGQYLRPTPNHAPVREYVTPERFRELEVEARALGFLYVASGPLVRSSYKAGEFFATRLIRGRRAAAGAPPRS